MLATTVLPSPGPLLVPRATSPSVVDENNVGPDRPQRFGELRCDAAIEQRGVLADHLGNHAEERQAQMRLDLVRRLDPIVEILEEERRPARPAIRRKCPRPHSASSSDSTAPAQFSLVDDRMLLVLSARDAGLFRALHQRFEDLAVARGVALERAVVDPLAVERQRVLFLLFERADQALFLRQRRLVIVLERLYALCDLALDARLGGLNRQLNLDHVGMTVTELVRQLGLLTLQFSQLGLLLLDELVRQNRRNRIERDAVVLDGPNLVVCGFLLDALGLARVTAAFRSASFCTTMFCRSSSETASFCSRYF
jgi:hypothetical protein